MEMWWGVGSPLAFTQGVSWAWEGAPAYLFLRFEGCSLSLVSPVELSGRATCTVCFILNVQHDIFGRRGWQEVPLFALDTSLYMITAPHHVLYLLKCAVSWWMTGRQMAWPMGNSARWLSSAADSQDCFIYTVEFSRTVLWGCRGTRGKCTVQVLDALLWPKFSKYKSRCCCDADGLFLDHKAGGGRQWILLSKTFPVGNGGLVIWQPTRALESRPLPLWIILYSSRPLHTLTMLFSNYVSQRSLGDGSCESAHDGVCVSLWLIHRMTCAP